VVTLDFPLIADGRGIRGWIDSFDDERSLSVGVIMAGAGDG